MPTLPSQNSTLRAELLGSKAYVDLLMRSSDQLGEWIVQAQGSGDIDPTLPPEVVLYTIFARACDPVPGFLKAGGQYSDEQIVELMLRICFDGLRGRFDGLPRRGPSWAARVENQRTSSTGVLQFASTLVATEPMTRLVSVPWPCEPIISRSNLPLSAAPAMVSAPGPPWHKVAVMPCFCRRTGESA
jgi:hypothetical protein